MDDEFGSGLLNIALSDPEGEDADEAGSASPAQERQQTRQDKKILSEAAFQALKASYRPKIENGEVRCPFCPFSIPTLPTYISSRMECLGTY